MTAKETEMQKRIDELEEEITSIKITYRLLEKLVIKLSDDMSKLKKNNLPLNDNFSKIRHLEVSK